MINEFFANENYGGSLFYYLFEFSNYIFVFLISLACLKLKKINQTEFYLFQIIFLSTFLFNYFLISPRLFPDQFTYTYNFIYDPGGGLFSGDSWLPNTKWVASQFFNLIPIPLIMTITSLVWVSKVYLFLTFVWIKKYISDDRLIILFLLPSIILYSSVTLREIFIIVTTIIALIHILHNRFVLGIIFTCLVATLKIQNGLFILVFWLLSIIYRISSNNIFLLFILILGFILAILVQDIFLQVISTYRTAFLAENLLGWDYNFDISESELLQITSYLDFLYISAQKIPEFIFLPLPWQWEGLFFIIQFLEAVFIVYLFGIIFFQHNLYKNKQFYTLFLAFLFGLTVYSVITANIGTAIRYRFSFYFPYLIAFYSMHEKIIGKRLLFFGRF
ncbi:hypothetical protein N9R17_01635 [Gammaproteobacteria bacterium]|nr:hypothetical protein [Gammaproteobacteria bacterium]